MTDRRSVISDLEEQIAWIRDNDFHKFPGWGHAVLAMKDALALLKAQEPVEPEPKEVIYDDVHRSVYCPRCDNRLAGLTYSGAVALETEETPNYCWMCGQAVKW